MTALAGVRNFKKIHDEFALTNRLRTEGTEYVPAGGWLPARAGSSHRAIRLAEREGRSAHKDRGR
jgi:hypothetical protein